ncbi:M23 family metallopeptidase [Aquibium sp. ELW1220]|uniref:M23 family metallopeptidase n=1 Tax=Aquibium sp. ELW1220 TaxID=2976766 RepID=UPI0025B19EF0|nr:M23 family metallopeptidase [Aquibium sp. ELW1220]MDN2579216.1 M23 family metallopeptidase [Aquibium sp. ELW1220]
MSKSRSSAVFGKRKEPHTFIIARGEEIRHFTVRPWMSALAGSALAACAVGYLLATSYLVLRDDLIGATVARQARLQQAYEDRISALRAQVDRITSRQMLDQQLVESKVAELIDRQEELTARNGMILPLLEKAAGEDVLPARGPVPLDRPEIRADLPLENAFAPTAAATASAAASALSSLAAQKPAADPQRLSAADRADLLFVKINRSLHAIEALQFQKIRAVKENAYKTADAIVAALKDAGLPVDPDYGTGDVGGPLVPVGADDPFETEVEELDDALTKLDGIRQAAVRLPIANPAPGQSVTSGFGVRRDPLIGRPAFHAGIDFRASVGVPVRASGAGTVLKAGWNGGYGRMVEIDHGNGLTTRYAHLSKLKVAEGDTVAAGAVVGLSGSSGRSTGPHLHYEVRRNGKATNPVRFISAGKAIKDLL